MMGNPYDFPVYILRVMSFCQHSGITLPTGAAKCCFVLVNQHFLLVSPGSVSGPIKISNGFTFVLDIWIKQPEALRTVDKQNRKQN